VRKTYTVKGKDGKIKIKKGSLCQTENELYYFHNDYMKACLLGWYVPLYSEVRDMLIYKTFVSKYYLAS